MRQTILLFGTIAGVLVAVPLYLTTMIWQGTPPPNGMLIGYATMLVALTAVFVGVKRHRDIARGGVIGFWPAFGMGLTISAVAALFYVAAWEAALASLPGDPIATFIDALIEGERAKGRSGAELAKFEADMRAFQVDYANPLVRLPMSFAEIFPVGVLVSLVSAALLRDHRFLPARGRAVPAPR